MRSPNWPCQLISGSSKSPATLANGCIISAPTRPDEFARPSGWAGESESSSSRGVADRVRRDDHHPAGSKCSAPSRSIQVAPVARPCLSVSMRRTRAPVTSARPGDRLRPVGQVGRRLRALVAARLARAALDARPAPVIRDRVDRVELRPPVPAELGHAAAIPSPPTRSAAAASARPRCRRIGRVARQPGHAEVAVGPVEVRQQLEVVDRPVVGDAVERADAEVRRERAARRRRR